MQCLAKRQYKLTKWDLLNVENVTVPVSEISLIANTAE